MKVVSAKMVFFNQSIDYILVYTNLKILDGVILHVYFTISCIFHFLFPFRN
jgi:hypothetical protein